VKGVRPEASVSESPAGDAGGGSSNGKEGLNSTCNWGGGWPLEEELASTRQWEVEELLPARDCFRLPVRDSWPA
jgi:hypothetical protein